MLKNILAVVAVVMVLAFAAGSEAASIVVLDTFTSNDGTVGSALAGRTPQDVNIPGDVWHMLGSQPDGVVTTDGALNIARANADDGYRTDISGLGATNMIVSTSMRYFSPNPTLTDVFRGAGVGFWSNNSTGNGLPYFTGLQLGSAGPGDPTLTLKLFSDTAGTFSAPLASLPYTGTRTGATDYHDLTYDVNTSTGAISNIILDGDSYSFSQTPFTVANTHFFGYVSTGFNGAETSLFDFVQLETPEPASAAVLMVGLGLLGLRRRRSVQ